MSNAEQGCLRTYDSRDVSPDLASPKASANPFSSGYTDCLVAQPAVADERSALSHPRRESAICSSFWPCCMSCGFAGAASFTGLGRVFATLMRKVLYRLRGLGPIDPDAKQLLFDASLYVTGREDYSICDDPLRCTGCSACLAVCPKSAITMVPNIEGFLIPRIDSDKCISCGRCRRVCPSNGRASETLKRDPVCAYAYKNTDDVRACSSSGGAFWALAKPVIDDGGVVYGAAFDESFVVRHIRCEDEMSLKRCRGSKYVQSDVGDCFASVHEDLAAGRTVLFSGTPCQVAGLKSYLKIRGGGVSRLILVDVLCHGAASPGLFSHHVEFLESRHGRLERFEFRNKDLGWHGYRNVAHFASEGKRFGYDVSAYQEVFDFSYAARPACSTCPYACNERVGDITLGDYWGVERHCPDIDDDGGVSLVIGCSIKGDKLARGIGPEMKLAEDQYGQGVLRHPCVPSADRLAFWHAYRTGGYVVAIKRFTRFGLIRRAARNTRRVFRSLWGRG